MRAKLRAERGSSDLYGTPWDRIVLMRATADARMALREVAATAAEAAARARIVAELLDEALVELQDKTPAPEFAPVSSVRSPGEPAVLSAREREVLALVAEGRTNKAIAAALFVSPNTVKTHVTSLLHKLHADTRIQLATIATAQGLHHVRHREAAESHHDRCHRQRARR